MFVFAMFMSICVDVMIMLSVYAVSFTGTCGVGMFLLLSVYSPFSFNSKLHTFLHPDLITFPHHMSKPSQSITSNNNNNIFF